MLCYLSTCLSIETFILIYISFFDHDLSHGFYRPEKGKRQWKQIASDVTLWLIYETMKDDEMYLRANPNKNQTKSIFFGKA